MTESTIILSLIGIVGTVVTALFKLLNANTRAQTESTKAMQALVAETRKGNREAAQRNGHLGEQNIKITELIIEHEKDVDKKFNHAVSTVIEAVQNVKKQHVVEQTVDKSTVKKED